MLDGRSHPTHEVTYPWLATPLGANDKQGIPLSINNSSFKQLPNSTDVK